LPEHYQQGGFSAAFATILLYMWSYVCNESMTELSQHRAGLAILWAVSLLFGWRVLVDTFALSLRDDEYTYILLILPVSAILVFLERRSLWKIMTLNIRTGPALLAIAALITCFAWGWSASLAPDAQRSMRMLALVLWWIGAFVLCYGSEVARSVLFPLLFLFGLVPLPQPVLNVIVALLQYWSAWAAYVFFAVFGVPVVRDGVVLAIPGLTVQVAEECSSIRSSSMLLVTTMVLSQLLLRSPWRRALVIGLAIPLSVAKNGLRIFTIAMLGTRVDPGYLTGELHRQGGIIFFGIALVVILALLWIVRKGDDLPLALDLSPGGSTISPNA
jgi:exosortase